MAFNKVAQENAKIATVDPIRSKQDIANICDWFYSKGWDKYAILFYFGVSSGLRISDILSLKVEDVYGKSKILMREQKTGKIKEFPLNDGLKEMMWDYTRGRDPKDWVFEGRQHRQLERSQVYRRINEAAQALGIDANVGTHTMRKTFGYHHFRQFNNITLLQTIFNHTSPDVTKRYIGITQDEINESYLALNLDVASDGLGALKELCNSRDRAVRVRSFCTNYIKNGGKKHKEFAQMVLEILFAQPKPRKKKIKSYIIQPKPMKYEDDDELIG